MKALVDTNVIVDALTSRMLWKDSAQQVFLMAARRRINLYITASSATDIYYLVRKHLRSAEQAKQVMGKLYSLMEILTVTGDECIAALASPINDYEDAVVERAALKANMDYIITRNEKDYLHGMVQAILPDDLILLLESD